MYAIQGVDPEAEVEIVNTWMIRLRRLTYYPPNFPDS